MSRGPQPVPKKPVKDQIVSVLRLENYQPLDPSAFSGLANPSVIWQAMVTDSPTAFKFYRDIEEKDSVVGSLLQLRREAVLRRPRTVAPASAAPEDKTRANFASDALQRLLALDEILDELLDAPAVGVTIAEILWEESQGRIAIRDIQPVPQEFFRFGSRFDRSQTGALRFVGEHQTLDLEVPEHKFIVFTFRPRSGNRRGRPLLRAVFWDSWAARQITKFMLQHSEKGNGTIAVKYPQGAGEEDKQAALAAAEAIFDEPAVALPQNFEIVTELLESARSGSVPDYLDRLDHLFAKITRRIIGQTLTMQGAEQGAGSRALGEVHQETFRHIVIADAERLERVVNQQVIRPLMVFNFGPGTPLPKFEIDKSEPVDLDRLAAVYRTLAELGVTLREGQVRRQFSLEEPQPGDKLLRPPSGEESPRSREEER